MELVICAAVWARPFASMLAKDSIMEGKSEGVGSGSVFPCLVCLGWIIQCSLVTD